MAKTGMSRSHIKSLLRNAAAGAGWALCVGAGISTPAFPDWKELVRRLAERDPNPPSSTVLAKLQATYSSDALIQASMDRLDLTEDKFAIVLAEVLYSDLLRTIEARSSTKLLIEALTARHIGSLTRTRWQEFLDLITLCFGNMTALRLAQTMSQLIQGPVAPTTIQSFNAEALFATLINANIATNRGVKGGDKLDLVVHATSDRKAGRIPYVFCHGLLPMPGTPKHYLSSVDKLVFQETAYLQLANTSFSWQSASFLRAAGGNSIVFVGVSLTDPNMRRWLSWVHATRVAELTEAGKPAPTSTVHYWIARTTRDEAYERWTESLVAHLGVRLIWVREYSEVAATLEVMAS